MENKTDNLQDKTFALDTRKPLSRRAALGLLSGAVISAALIGCGGSEEADTTTTSSGSDSGTSDSGSTDSGSCVKVAEETNGPFPADGTNTNSGITKNVLTDSRAFRTDIRSDFDGSNVQTGIPLTLTMTLENFNGSCAALAGYYVYVWHCNRTGNYSQYSGTMNGGDYSSNTFLRGIGVTDSSGKVTFTTVFPGRYSGRATHIHYEVYPDNSPQHSEVKATSQLAFPASVTDTVYTNTTLYPTSAANNTTNESDGIFSDGTSTEMLTITGNNSSGYVATITVAVAA